MPPEVKVGTPGSPLGKPEVTGENIGTPGLVGEKVGKPGVTEEMVGTPGPPGGKPGAPVEKVGTSEMLESVGTPVGKGRVGAPGMPVGKGGRVETIAKGGRVGMAVTPVEKVGMVGRVDRMDVVKVGRPGKVGMSVGRVGRVERVERVGLTVGIVGPEVLERPLGRVIFGNAGAVPGRPGILVSVTGRTGVVGVIVDVNVLLLVVIVVRLPTTLSRGIDGDAKLGSTIGGFADGVSPENSDIVLGKPPVPLYIDVGRTSEELKEGGRLGYTIVKKTPQLK